VTFSVVPALTGRTGISSAQETTPSFGVRQNCSICHSTEPGQNLVGPTLFSVVGRPAASVANFPYSAAMKNSGIRWTTNELMVYLRAPREYLPGVKMMFAGLPDPKDRENVVAFLATLSHH
jgi:cytochrome c